MRRKGDKELDLKSLTIRGWAEEKWPAREGRGQAERSREIHAFMHVCVCACMRVNCVKCYCEI